MVPKRRYLSYLRNRWWVVMICVALLTISVLAYETLRQETYSSYAQLYLTLGPQIGANVFTEPKDDYATEIELLKGSHLRRATMESLGSGLPAHFNGSIDIDVVRPMGASILQLKATSSDATVSQKFLQALIQQYLNFKQDTRLKTAEDLVASLKLELDQREDTLKTNQEKWAEFQKTNNVPLMQEEAKTAGSFLADLKIQLERLTLERQLLAQGLALETNPASANLAISTTNANLTNGTAALFANATNSSPVTPLETDTALKFTRTDLAESRAQLEYLKSAMPGKAVHYETDAVLPLERKVAVLEKIAADQHQESLKNLDKRIAAMQAQIPIVEASLTNAADTLSAAQLIKDETQRQQVYYDNLLAMLRTVDLNKNMAQERVTLMDPPSPGTPAQRSLPLRIFLAVAGGLAIGLGLVFVWHMVDDRLVSIHDVKDQFGETVLGLLPQVRVPKSKPFAALLEPADTRAGYVESYRHLRSALLLSSLGEGRPQTLLFTGAIPAEGKTTIAVNLARLLAQSGLRVALVDADIRGGHIHQMLGRAAAPGFLDFLRGQSEAKAIIYPTEVAGLSFVPVGAANEEIDGLLTHANLGALMDELKTGRDFVIIDSAPMLAADDASLLVPFTDAVIMVVRPFYTRARQARRALEMLYQRQTKQVALVLNRARADDLAGQYYEYKRTSPAAKNGKV